MRDNCPKCNGELKKYRSENGLYTYECPACAKKGFAKDPDTAWGNFCKFLGVKNTGGPAEAAQPMQRNTQVAKRESTSIADTDGRMSFIRDRHTELERSASSLLTKGALEKLLERNAAYIVTEKMFDPLWQTEEGRASLLDCFNEALSYAAELPTLGYIIPYGETATFIPRVEAFQNILTYGPNAPFEWINIEAIHERDKTNIKRVNGSFTLEFENIATGNRGNVISIAVYGYHKRRKMVIGDVYEAQRLFEKGTASSSAYREYQRVMNNYLKAQSEGRVASDDKGEYFEDVRFKKNGDTYTKKIYISTVTNPYEGPHREEMLKKVAGKTFMTPFKNERIGSAVIDDIQALPTPIADDSAAGRSVNLAEAQFPEVVGEEPVATEDVTDVPEVRDSVEESQAEEYVGDYEDEQEEIPF